MAAPATTPPQPQPAPAPPPMTAEEFGLRYSGEHVEYINGKVRRPKMAGPKHGKVNFRFAFALGRYNEAGDRGHIFINDTFVKVPTRRDPERVYGADVCYVAYTKLAKDAAIPDSVLPVPPDLVVETRCPSDGWAAVFRKAGVYLQAGVPVVVVLDPATRTATVCTDADVPKTLGPADTLTLPGVLPGFAVPVAALFG